MKFITGILLLLLSNNILAKELKINEQVYETWDFVKNISEDINVHIFVNKHRFKQGEYMIFPAKDKNMDPYKIKTSFASDIKEVFDDKEINYKGEKAYYVSGVSGTKPKAGTEPKYGRIDFIVMVVDKQLVVIKVTSAIITKNTDKETETFLNGLIIK